MDLFVKSGKAAWLWNALILIAIVMVAVILGSLFIKQQTFSSATKKPVQGDTYTKNVFAVGGKKAAA